MGSFQSVQPGPLFPIGDGISQISRGYFRWTRWSGPARIGDHGCQHSHRSENPQTYVNLVPAAPVFEPLPAAFVLIIIGGVPPRESVAFGLTSRMV